MYMGVGMRVVEKGSDLKFAIFLPAMPATLFDAKFCGIGTCVFMFCCIYMFGFTAFCSIYTCVLLH